MERNPKTVVITGGNSGLGYETAKQLVKDGGWQIVVASRDIDRVNTAIAELARGSDDERIVGMQLDLGSFASIRAFARDLLSKDLPPLHAIVANAGVLPIGTAPTTADGIETAFGVNHLGHYLLLQLLSEALVEPARVVLVSSGTHVPGHRLAKRAGIPAPHYVEAVHLAYPDRAPADARIEDPLQRYTTSKLCNVLCAYELARQFQAKGKNVAVFAIDPGAMPGTGLYRGRSALLRASMRVLAPVLSLAVDGVQLPRQSGRDIVRLLTDPELQAKTGLYFDCGKEARSSEDSYDRHKAVDLWNTSAELCGLRGDEAGLPTALGAEERLRTAH